MPGRAQWSPCLLKVRRLHTCTPDRPRVEPKAEGPTFPAPILGDYHGARQYPIRGTALERRLEPPRLAGHLSPIRAQQDGHSSRDQCGMVGQLGRRESTFRIFLDSVLQPNPPIPTQSRQDRRPFKGRATQVQAQLREARQMAEREGIARHPFLRRGQTEAIETLSPDQHLGTGRLQRSGMFHTTLQATALTRNPRPTWRQRAGGRT